MAASDYIKTVSIADTIVQDVAGRNVTVTRSTVGHIHGDDVEMHHAIAGKVLSENDVYTYQSITGTLQGRIVKVTKSASFYTKAEVLESKNTLSLITSAETVQGTMYTVFTKTTAAIFAGVLLLGYQLIKRRSR